MEEEEAPAAKRQHVEEATLECHICYSTDVEEMVCDINPACIHYLCRSCKSTLQETRMRQRQPFTCSICREKYLASTPLRPDLVERESKAVRRRVEQQWKFSCPLHGSHSCWECPLMPRTKALQQLCSSLCTFVVDGCKEDDFTQVLYHLKKVLYRVLTDDASDEHFIITGSEEDSEVAIGFCALEFAIAHCRTFEAIETRPLVPALRSLFWKVLQEGGEDMKQKYTQLYEWARVVNVSRGTELGQRVQDGINRIRRQMDEGAKRTNVSKLIPPLMKMYRDRYKDVIGPDSVMHPDILDVAVDVTEFYMKQGMWDRVQMAAHGVLFSAPAHPRFWETLTMMFECIYHTGKCKYSMTQTLRHMKQVFENEVSQQSKYTPTEKAAIVEAFMAMSACIKAGCLDEDMWERFEFASVQDEGLRELLQSTGKLMCVLQETDNIMELQHQEEVIGHCHVDLWDLMEESPAAFEKGGLQECMMVTLALLLPRERQDMELLHKLDQLAPFCSGGQQTSQFMCVHNMCMACVGEVEHESGWHHRLASSPFRMLDASSLQLLYLWSLIVHERPFGLLRTAWDSFHENMTLGNVVALCELLLAQGGNLAYQDLCMEMVENHLVPEVAKNPSIQTFDIIARMGTTSLLQHALRTTILHILDTEPQALLNEHSDLFFYALRTLELYNSNNHGFFVSVLLAVLDMPFRMDVAKWCFLASSHLLSENALAADTSRSIVTKLIHYAAPSLMEKSPEAVVMLNQVLDLMLVSGQVQELHTVAAIANNCEEWVEWKENVQTTHFVLRAWLSIGKCLLQADKSRQALIYFCKVTAHTRVHDETVAELKELAMNHLKQCTL